jgi:hypothetical protein
MTVEPLTIQVALLVRDYGLADVLHAVVTACERQENLAGVTARADAWGDAAAAVARLRAATAGTWSARGEPGPPLYPLPEPTDAGPV